MIIFHKHSNLIACNIIEITIWKLMNKTIKNYTKSIPFTKCQYSYTTLFFIVQPAKLFVKMVRLKPLIIP